ncbi:MAG TPA: PEGA domain-containing protein [Terriglobales bacterium]|nr:PEGA domain-containing protein [Terriglobales bacterium]
MKVRGVVFVVMMAFAAISLAAEKPRVFVTDSQSWSMSGGGGGSSSGFGGGTSGGARPQTAEIVKTFGERCSEVVVNNIREKADYVIVLDHEGGKGWIRKDNKVAVFNKEGDAIISKSTRSLGNSVEEGCKAIVADWEKRGPVVPAAQKEQEPSAAAQPVATTVGTPQLWIAPQEMNGAEVEIDGTFVGTTPSKFEVTPGEHDIKITKSGYKTWQRKIKVMSGTVNVSPTLEKQ